jgi:hypothetical protein
MLSFWKNCRRPLEQRTATFSPVRTMVRLAALLIAINAAAWLLMLSYLQSTPRNLECRLIELDPLGGRRYHTITTNTWGLIDQSSGAIGCYFR